MYLQGGFGISEEHEILCAGARGESVKEEGARRIIRAEDGWRRGRDEGTAQWVCNTPPRRPWSTSTPTKPPGSRRNRGAAGGGERDVEGIEF